MLPRLWMAVLMGVVLALPSLVPAETAPGSGDSNVGPRPVGPGSVGAPGGGFRADRGMDDVKAQIRASDEEWKVIGPKLRKVIAARQVAEFGRLGMGFGLGGGPGGFGGPPGRGRRSFGGPPGGGPSAFGGPGGGGPGGPPPGGGPGAFRGPGGGGPGVPGGPPSGGPGVPGGPPSGGPGVPGGPPSGGPGVPGAPPGGVPGVPGGPPSGVPGVPGGPPSGVPGVPGGPPPVGPGIFGGPPPGGPGGGGFGQIAQAQTDLQAAVNDPKASPEDIKEKVAALRKAREKAKADLEAAQRDLVELLTAYQEAVLVGLGYLD